MTAGISIKAREWLHRYVPLEIAGTLGAIVGVAVAYAITAELSVSVVVASIAESVLFYTAAAIREARRHTAVSRWTIARNIILEFGPSEILDTLLIRPTLMYLAISMTGSIGWGTIFGKIAADVVFYLPAIASYELRSRHINRNAQ